MSDRYANHNSGLESPATHGFAITPDDDADLPEATRAIFVGAAGAVSAILVSGATVTLAGIPAGTVLPVRATRVLATATTAGALVGLV